jgi:uncharacterized protein YkwD
MIGTLARRTALAVVALAALTALLASSAVATPRRPAAALGPLERGLVAPSHVATPRRTAAALSPLEYGVLAAVNTVRAHHGLAALHLSAALTAAALRHTREMATDGYFKHESADGTAFWKRIASFYPSQRWSFWSVGENLLYARPDLDADAAIQLWLDSPPHRANLLSAQWREIGIAAVHATAAPGEYGGRDVMIVTTDFGVRR